MLDIKSIIDNSSFCDGVSGPALAEPIPHDALPRAWGAPVAHGRLRARAEDFVVEEQLGFEPDGEGEHLLLQLRKIGLNTRDLARHLARLAGVRLGDVGYCGLKDRHAVATQWFSVRLARRAVPEWSPPAAADVALLRSARHRRKLRPGSHRANRFALTLRAVRGDVQAQDARLRLLAERGFPNYFGAQRFGRLGTNPERARAVLRGTARARRAERGLLISALRAALFNQVLAARVADGSWDQARAGEVLMLDGSHSLFAAAADDTALEARVRALDVHPTGPLCGTARDALTALSAREVERLAGARVDLDALARAGVRAARRALRARVEALRWARPAPDVLVLEFVLAPGVYATSLARELLAQAAPMETG